MRPDLWLLLPAYEEAASLPLLLADVRSTWTSWAGAPRLHVVVVDDGSTDGTSAAARSVPGLDVTVLVHRVNRGLGVAMRTGIEHVLARARPEDLVATMDADHTHPPELLPRLVAKARGGAELVVASRFQPGAEVLGLGALRRAVSRVASLFLRATFPGARDYTCGYRIYRAHLLRWGRDRYGAAFLNQAGFAVMVDLLLKLRRPAGRISEVPLLLRYDRKRSTSKMRLAGTTATTLALLCRRFRGDPTGPGRVPPPCEVAVLPAQAPAPPTRTG